MIGFSFVRVEQASWGLGPGTGGMLILNFPWVSPRAFDHEYLKSDI